MPRTNAYELRNLGLLKKLAASLALLCGLLLFISGWVVSVVAINWSLSWMTLVDWGIRVGMLTSDLRWVLLAAHVISLGLLLPLSLKLMRRTPLPRLTRRSLFALATALAFLDLSAWLLLPFLAFAQAALGAIVLVLTLLLGYLVGAPLSAMWQPRRWSEPARPVRVVIVGGGFAGLDSALGLDRALGWSEQLELTVIDRKNYFLFPPLLPSVSVGAIETRQVTYPFRRIFEATNIRFKKETVERIDLERNLIVSKVDVAAVEDGAWRVRYDETPFDYLVLSPGSTTQTFGTPGCEHAFFMREVADAIALRNHVLDCFETAARESNHELTRGMLRFVVIGAGPTGVEVASEVRDLIDQVLLSRYPEIDAALIDVVLVDTGERVLPGWDNAVAESVERQLSGLGVRVLHQARVEAISADWVRFKGGATLETRTACWCAGVAAAPLMARTGLRLDRTGRASVEADCRVPGYPNVFVLGDAAMFPGKDGRPLPPLGQVAFQQGAHTAKNLVRLLRGEATRPFEYFDFGQLVSVGHQFAAVRLLGVRLSGFVAWFVWRTLYLGKLVGFGNKIRVMLDWTLDLFVERSGSQIHATREKLEAAALAPDHEPQREPARDSLTHEPSDRRRSVKRLLSVLIAGTLLVACGDDEAVDAGGGHELLTRVQAESYREWRRAPGWESRLPSIGGGHGGELDIYVNETIAKVVDRGQSVEALPIGSTIVKDVWNAGTLHAIAIMDKRVDGWFWAEFDGASRVLAAGHPSGCLDCHRRGADYVRAFALP